MIQDSAAFLPLALPVGFQGRTSLPSRAQMLPHPFGYHENRLRIPSEALFGQAQFLRPEGRPMGIGAVLLVRRAEPDMGPGDDQGRAGVALGPFQRGIHLLQVFPFHPQHLPAVGQKPGCGLLAGGQGGIPFDGDVVVEKDGDEVAETQVSGQGGGFRRHALHQVAVRAQGIDSIVEQDRIDLLRQKTPPHGHAHGNGQALSQGPGGGFHAGGMTELGMPRRFAAELPKGPEIIQGQAVAGQVQHAVEKHGGMAAGQYETIPPRPFRVEGIVAQVAGKQQVGEGSCLHGGPGMSGPGQFNGIGRQQTNGIDGFPGQIGGRQSFTHCVPPRAVTGSTPLSFRLQGTSKSLDATDRF